MLRNCRIFNHHRRRTEAYVRVQCTLVTVGERVGVRRRILDVKSIRIDNVEHPLRIVRTTTSMGNRGIIFRCPTGVTGGRRSQVTEFRARLSPALTNSGPRSGVDFLLPGALLSGPCVYADDPNRNIIILENNETIASGRSAKLVSIDDFRPRTMEHRTRWKSFLLVEGTETRSWSRWWRTTNQSSATSASQSRGNVSESESRVSTKGQRVSTANERGLAHSGRLSLLARSHGSVFTAASSRNHLARMSRRQRHGETFS